MSKEEKCPAGTGKILEVNHEARGRFLLPQTMEKLYIGGKFHDTSDVVDVILGLHGLSVDMLLNCVVIPSTSEYREKQASIMRFLADRDSDSLDERRTKGYLRRELDLLLWGLNPQAKCEANYKAGQYSKWDYFSL
ncbi:hypothetical protein BKK51_05610 [Rodentibacter trehalosifermentans]|uniref:Uncharacterized protein n=1 Tax=Rodentibacter trehalosifermentans TaxID=1908263 RepID=A0A1V3ITR3_9PAST|nr:hypothetical protein [Rodentibacter trehalosifermentans]OOF45662.1 hypothetical protein BKK51_05610 [Rodentibacter trehalosifermentans]OOF48424.1 hypothetical protein BKK52_05955 [Rodentibacter trehalosifermentans]